MILIRLIIVILIKIAKMEMHTNRTTKIMNILNKINKFLIIHLLQFKIQIITRICTINKYNKTKIKLIMILDNNKQIQEQKVRNNKIQNI